MFVNGSGRYEHFNRRPSIDASYQVSVHLVKRFQRRRIKKTNQKQELPVAVVFINGSGRNEHSLQRPLHRCFLLSFGSLGPAVLKKIKKKLPIRNKNRLWRPCLLTDRDEMSKSLQRTCHRCFLPSFSSFGPGVSEEKIKMWKVNGRQTPSDGTKLTLPLTRWGKNCWLLFLLFFF